MAKKKQRGHYCRVCGRQRANEKFSGTGHVRHICRDCEREQRQARRKRKKAKDEDQPVLLTRAQVEMLCAWLDGSEGCNFREDGETGEILWECDHTLRLTRQWLKQTGMDVDTNIQMLNDCGGFCDCEVVFNVLQSWPED